METPISLSYPRLKSPCSDQTLAQTAHCKGGDFFFDTGPSFFSGLSDPVFRHEERVPSDRSTINRYVGFSINTYLGLSKMDGFEGKIPFKVDDWGFPERGDTQSGWMWMVHNGKCHLEMDENWGVPLWLRKLPLNLTFTIKIWGTLYRESGGSNELAGNIVI